MAAKAALLRVLAACLACAAAERNTLRIVAHAAQSNDTAADEGLSYGGLDEWHSKALGKLDAFTSSVGAELETATADALSESDKYAQMMHGLEADFETFKSSVASFRSANIHAQGKSNEEVRQVLQSARRTATEAKANATAEAAKYWQDQAKAETDSEETAEVRDEDEAKQAENLTGSNVSVPPSGAVHNFFHPEEEEETSGLKPLFEEEEEASHKAENLTSSNASVPPNGAGVKNLEPEEEEESSGLRPLFEEEEEASHKAETLISSNVSVLPGGAGVKKSDPNLTGSNVSVPPSGAAHNFFHPEEEEETSGLKPLFEEEEASHKAHNRTSPNVSVPPSGAGVKNLEPEEEEETSGLKPLFEEEEASHKAENLTSPNVSVDVAEADVSAKKAKSEIAGIEADLARGNNTGDAAATQKAVQKVVPEEEDEQARATLACFALADSPLRGKDRRCDSEAVSGMFEGKPCEGHEGQYFTPEAACGTSDKCEAKHVCLKTVDGDGDQAVVEADDGSWQVNDDAKCFEGSASVVCVPRTGSYRLPPKLDE